MTFRTIALAGLMLVGCARTPLRPTTAPAPTTAASAPFEKEILAFEAADRAAYPPPKDGIVFYGSSSFRIWKTLATDLGDAAIVNRGFGGSGVTDCVRYLDRAVVPLRPRVVVLYAGDNDLAAGRTPALVVSDTEKLFDRLLERFPNVRIVYVSVKPSPARAALLPQAAEVNRRVAESIDRRNARGKQFTFVDVATPMLGPDGQPRGELFGSDRLHMNAAGYALWTSILRPVVATVR